MSFVCLYILLKNVWSFIPKKILLNQYTNEIRLILKWICGFWHLISSEFIIYYLAFHVDVQTWKLFFITFKTSSNKKNCLKIVSSPTNLLYHLFKMLSQSSTFHLFWYQASNSETIIFWQYGSSGFWRTALQRIIYHTSLLNTEKIYFTF